MRRKCLEKCALLVVVLAVILLFLDSYHSKNPYFEVIYVNGKPHTVHEEGGTLYVSAKGGSVIADREIELVFDTPSGKKSRWEVLETENVQVIYGSLTHSLNPVPSNYQDQVKILIGIYGEEAGSFRMVDDHSSRRKDMIEIFFGESLKVAEGGDVSDTANNFDELTIYVNREPHVVKVDKEPVKATAVDGEIELLLPRWKCMKLKQWQVEEKPNSCTVVDMRTVTNNVEVKSEVDQMFRKLQKIRLRVEEGSEGTIQFVAECDLGKPHKIEVAYK